MQIRAVAPSDWDQIWPIVKAVVDAGETYVWRPTPPPDQMRRIWLEPPPWEVFVAERRGQILGTAKLGPNRPGRGSHVATASFIVDPESQGQGVGRSLAEFVIERARDRGYRGMQFNAVVETNRAAVALWQSLGFSVIGTVPAAFEHPGSGLVGLHIMYRDLTDAAEPGGTLPV